MKTFTTDSIRGEFDNEFTPIRAALEADFNRIADDWIKVCAANDIEVLSAEGLFISAAFRALTLARCSFICEYDLKKEKEI